MKKKIAPLQKQPQTFQFTPENLKKVEEILNKYPAGRKKSAVLPFLYLVMQQHQNWIPTAAMDYVANLIGVPYIKVYEVASFYSMLNTAPVGQHLIQVCRTTPCWLRGSDKICDKIKAILGIEIGQTTKDGKFSLVEVECLGACVNAPVVQINNDYYEDLDEEKIASILKSLENTNN